jgi:hypothetical protein
MKTKYKCECCGEKRTDVEKYEVTSFWVNRNIKYEDLLCSDCVKRFPNEVKKISPTYPCDGCGEEVSFYQLNKVPILVHNDGFDNLGFCDDCFNRAEDQEERLTSGRCL